MVLVLAIQKHLTVKLTECDKLAEPVGFEIGLNFALHLRPQQIGKHHQKKQRRTVDHEKRAL